MPSIHGSLGGSWISIRDLQLEDKKDEVEKNGNFKRGSRFLYHQLSQSASSASESEESSPLPPEGERMHSPLMYMPPWASQAARACSSSSCFCIASSYPGQDGSTVGSAAHRVSRSSCCCIASSYPGRDGSEVGSASHFASKSSSSLEEEEPLLDLAYGCPVSRPAFLCLRSIQRGYIAIAARLFHYGVRTRDVGRVIADLIEHRSGCV